MKDSIKKIIFLIPGLFLTIALSAQNTEVNKIELTLVKTAEDADLQWGPCPPFMPNGCSIAILHGDPSKKNLDVFFKVAANSDIPNHWHNSAERMILISGKLEVTYKG